jgi:hypothetical protein
MWAGEFLGLFQIRDLIRNAQPAYANFIRSLSPIQEIVDSVEMSDLKQIIASHIAGGEPMEAFLVAVAAKKFPGEYLMQLLRVYCETQSPEAISIHIVHELIDLGEWRWLKQLFRCGYRFVTAANDNVSKLLILRHLKNVQPSLLTDALMTMRTSQITEALVQLEDEDADLADELVDALHLMLLNRDDIETLEAEEEMMVERERPMFDLLREVLTDDRSGPFAVKSILRYLPPFDDFIEFIIRDEANVRIVQYFVDIAGHPVTRNAVLAACSALNPDVIIYLFQRGHILLDDQQISTLLLRPMDAELITTNSRNLEAITQWATSSEWLLEMMQTWWSRNSARTPPAIMLLIAAYKIDLDMFIRVLKYLPPTLSRLKLAELSARIVRGLHASNGHRRGRNLIIRLSAYAGASLIHIGGPQSLNQDDWNCLLELLKKGYITLSDTISLFCRAGLHDVEMIRGWKSLPNIQDDVPQYAARLIHQCRYSADVLRWIAEDDRIQWATMDQITLAFLAHAQVQQLPPSMI